MHKRVGANKRRWHGEKRRRAARTAGRALAKGLSVSKVLAIAVCVCGAGIFAAVKIVSWMNRSPVFTVSALRVEGNMRVDKAEAIRLSGLHAGMRMMEIKPPAAARAVLQSLWARRVHVVRRFPNTVVIRIEERKPIALVNAGRVRYMDDEGLLLPLFCGTYSNLPVVSGFRPDTAGRLPGEALARVKRFIDECGQANQAFAKRISQIDFSKAPRIRLKLEDFPAAVEMNESQARLAAGRLRQIVESAQEETKGLPKRINLCYENLAYVQW